METRLPHARTLILTGAFALLCLIVTIGVYSEFGGTLPFTVQGYQVTIPLPAADNLVAGSEVEIAGVQVGKVHSVTRAGAHARAVLDLANRFAPLHAGATAIMRTKTLLGEGYVELAPGPQSAPAVPDGGTLSARQVQPTVQLDQLISTFDPATRASFRALLGGLATAFDGREGSLSDTLGWAAPLSANLDDVLETLQRQGTQLGGLVAASGRVMQAIGIRSGALQAAITAGEQVFATTAQRSRALRETIQALAPFLGQLQATSAQLRAASPVLTAAARALLPDATQLTPALMALQRAAPQFTTLFDRLPDALDAARTGLPALGAVVHAARDAFQQFYPTSRQLIPFMQLFGVNKQIVSVLANVSSVTSGTYVGPGGTVSNYLTALPTFWNESISGWTKKLPTNRQNPYPESPAALLETGQIGVLKAFDCRNIHNPLWLPATGSGAPPCILQGPFTFDGRTAYYPRLTIAPP